MQDQPDDKDDLGARLYGTPYHATKLRLALCLTFRFQFEADRSNDEFPSSHFRYDALEMIGTKPSLL